MLLPAGWRGILPLAARRRGVVLPLGHSAPLAILLLLLSSRLLLADALVGFLGRKVVESGIAEAAAGPKAQLRELRLDVGLKRIVLCCRGSLALRLWHAALSLPVHVPEGRDTHSSCAVGTVGLVECFCRRHALRLRLCLLAACCAVLLWLHARLAGRPFCLSRHCVSL